MNKRLSRFCGIFYGVLCTMLFALSLYATPISAMQIRQVEPQSATELQTTSHNSSGTRDVIISKDDKDRD